VDDLLNIAAAHCGLISAKIFDDPSQILFDLVDQFSRRADADPIGRQPCLRDPGGVGELVEVVLRTGLMVGVSEELEAKNAQEARGNESK
jgi:hypothetical protein